LGRKVRKRLNVDPEKLRQAREYLQLDRLLDNCVFERELEALQREYAPVLRRFRARLARQQRSVV
jgi:hypothetical protein